MYSPPCGVSSKSAFGNHFTERLEAGCARRLKLRCISRRRAQPASKRLLVCHAKNSLTSPSSSHGEPEREDCERDCAARHVQIAVVYRACARRQEALMILVHERDCGGEREGREPPKASKHREPRHAERTRGEQRENRILRQVRGLAHKEVDCLNRTLRDVWIEPEQERANDSRSVRRRELSRRSEKHEGRPREQRAVTPEAARAASVCLKAPVHGRYACARTPDRARVPARMLVCVARASLILRRVCRQRFGLKRKREAACAASLFESARPGRTMLSRRN